MALGTTREIVPSAARTTSAASGVLAIGGPSRHLALAVDVTAASGTSPTLDFSVQWSTDGGATFFDVEVVDSFGQITTAPRRRLKLFDVKAPHYRVVWDITGVTPSFTFAVDAYER